jgi:adenine-specific DNA-methyltransferase
VPHVTLKSIANNPDIKEGMSREEIDRAILRHAETETLYDKPYEDKGRLRVTGPFTVESLSPHRTISVEDKRQAAAKPTADGFTIKMLAGGSFSNTILDYLRKSPVQTGKKEERLRLASVEVFAGQWVNGEGRYAEADGTERRVAICIGPEYGTVGPELVKEAAKEAVKGVGFDVLLVCGFAFDPHVTEEAKRYGKLKVLPVRMNPDLSMGDELLKKTGAGNLFMVFGEPDLSVDETKDGKLVVEIRGVDVYDPTTGEVRSNTTDDIACWFIDTDYDGESFFVRTPTSPAPTSRTRS